MLPEASCELANWFKNLTEDAAHGSEGPLSFLRPEGGGFCDTESNHMSRWNATSSHCSDNNQDANNDLYGFVLASSWHVVSKLPYLFYLVWPTETMFSSLAQVPRYVTEVSFLANRAFIDHRIASI